MTVSTTVTRNEYAGTAGVFTYAFTFRCDDAAWVEVYLDDVLQVAGYSVTVNDDQDASPGGEVEFIVAPEGKAVEIRRVTPLTQAVDLAAYAAFPAESVEHAIDKVALQVQDQARIRADADSAEAAARAAGDAAIIASGVVPANVGLAPLSVNGGVVKTLVEHLETLPDSLLTVNGGTPATPVEHLATLPDTLITTTGTTTPRRLQARFSDAVNVLDFENDGVDPTGATDSTAGFAAAAAACVANGGGDIIIPAGEYLLADLASPSGVRWLGQGASRSKLKRLNAGGGETFLVKFNGSVGATSALSGNAEAGDYSVDVGNGALWAAGDWALIREATYTGTLVGRKQQIVRVLSVAGDTVNIDRPLFEAYTTAASAELCVLNPVVNAGLYDLALEGVNSSASGGLVRAQYAIGLELDSTVAQYFSSVAAYSLSTCLDSHLRNVTARDGVDVSTMGQGYGAELDEACSFCTIEDSTFENIREVTITNRTNWSRFARNRVFGAYDNGINSHGAFCQHVDLDDNVIVGVRNGSGITIGYSTHSAGDYDVRVRRNTIKHASAYGIVSSAPVGKEHERVVFEGNRVFPAGAPYGIAASYTNNFFSRGNYVDFEGGSGGNTGYYLVAVNRGRLVDDWVRDAAGTYGFRYDTCTNVDFDACETDGLDGGYEYQDDGGNTGVTFRRGATFSP